MLFILLHKSSEYFFRGEWKIFVLLFVSSRSLYKRGHIIYIVWKITCNIFSRVRQLSLSLSLSRSPHLLFLRMILSRIQCHYIIYWCMQRCCIDVFVQLLYIIYFGVFFSRHDTFKERANVQKNIFLTSSPIYCSGMLVTPFRLSLALAPSPTRSRLFTDKLLMFNWKKQMENMLWEREGSDWLQKANAFIDGSKKSLKAPSNRYLSSLASV